MKVLSVFLFMLFAAANVMAAPFSDLPANHWAHNSVRELAHRGILQGFPDGTYKGDQAVSRYALAMVVAKTLVSVEQQMIAGGQHYIRRSDLDRLEELAIEFADELALIGVKITALEDDMRVVQSEVAELKTDVAEISQKIDEGALGKVRLSGDMIVRHLNVLRRESPTNDNNLTEQQIRLRFTMNIDENVTAVARWRLFHHSGYPNVSAANPLGRRGGAYGREGIGGLTTSDNTMDTAFLRIRDMFRFGGDFLFGRAFQTHGHALLVNNYLDVVRYTKKAGDVDVSVQAIYDRHTGNYKDDEDGVDFRNVWNLNLGTNHNGHDLYLGVYAQDEPNLMGWEHDVLNPPATLGNTVAGQLESDSRWDVEFGSKGPLGRSENWSYGIGMAYSDYSADVVSGNTAGVDDFISPSMQGWMGHGEVKWDSKDEWSARVAYTFADDEHVGPQSINNYTRYADAPETPYVDIARGNRWFSNGLQNMNLVKVETEYRPRDTKHYFRVAGDFLSEYKNTVSNDFARMEAGDVYSSSVLPTSANMVDTEYDRFNNFGISEAKATVLTFEYRYQLAQNTRIRFGFTSFRFDGKETRDPTDPNYATAGRNANNRGDYDHNVTWTEIFSRF